jgi:hypothetical protein
LLLSDHLINEFSNYTKIINVHEMLLLGSYTKRMRQYNHNKETRVSREQVATYVIIELLLLSLMLRLWAIRQFVAWRQHYK